MLVKLRLIDHSLNAKANKIYKNTSSAHANITLFANANTSFDLPRAFRMGDIIRIHRVNIKDY